MPVSGMAIGSIAAGSVLMYAGITGKSALATLYSLVSGNQPKNVQVMYPISGTSSGAGTTAAGSGSGLPSGNTTPGVAGSSVAQYQAYAFSLFAGYGWGADQQPFLIELWNQESGWDPTIWEGGSHAATEPGGSSGAYGIAQSLPYTKYPKAGWPPGYGGSADAATQIKWGLDYIFSVYKNPEGAWAHEKANNWY